MKRTCAVTHVSCFPSSCEMTNLASVAWRDISFARASDVFPWMEGGRGKEGEGGREGGRGRKREGEREKKCNTPKYDARSLTICHTYFSNVLQPPAQSNEHN